MSTMTDSDREVIRRFAAGDKSLRDQAIAIFKANEDSAPQAPEILFMAEATSLVPDHLQQAQYRRMLVVG